MSSRSSRPVERAPVVVFDAGHSVLRGFAPRAPLSQAVELIWTTSGTDYGRVERVLPNGVMELIFNLGGPQRVVHGAGRYTRYRELWVAGIQRAPLDIASEQDSQLVGIRFRPGGAAPLLGLPAHAITDAVVELSGAGLGWARGLRQRLLDASSCAERAAIAEQELTARLLSGRAVDPRIALSLRAMARLPAGLRLSSLAAELGVSHKHLIALFKREVGVPPKTLQRVLRFQAALQAISTSPAPSWTHVAHACGYADQSHLNHDFRALAGIAPSAYLAQRLVDPNHLGLGEPAR